MQRHDFLTGLHSRLRPRGYLEIGVRNGAGLARSRTRTIGVDPDFSITAELACDLQLVATTSDEFFARPDPLSWLPGGVADLAFIDGMHLFEFALRDFINTERHSAPGGVVVFDDVLPRRVEHAARQRQTTVWAGDVYKIVAILEQYRPDLAIVPVDTDPTGTLLVAGLDPTSSVLSDRYDEIVAAYDVADPQPVPEEILVRRTAADPQVLLSRDEVWERLLVARASGDRPNAAVATLRSLRGTATPRPLQPARPATGPGGGKAGGSRPGFAQPPTRHLAGPAVRGATVAILLVNGYDRVTDDPFSEEEAIAFPWVDLCLSRVARHTADVDHEVLVWDNARLPQHDAILERHGVTVFGHPDGNNVRHGRSLDGLFRQVDPRTTYVVTLDTDSFPVRDGWLSDILARLDGGADLVGVWREEMTPDITPYIHPSCLAARRETLAELGVSFQIGQSQDVAQNISLRLAKQGGRLSGLRRSNARDPHFLLGGIYGDLVYHHGAGSRKATFWTSMEDQADEAARIVLRDAAFTAADDLFAYLRGETSDGEAERAGLRDVVALVNARTATLGRPGAARPAGRSPASGLTTSVRRLASRIRK